MMSGFLVTLKVVWFTVMVRSVERDSKNNGGKCMYGDHTPRSITLGVCFIGIAVQQYHQVGFLLIQLEHVGAELLI